MIASATTTVAVGSQGYKICQKIINMKAYTLVLIVAILGVSMGSAAPLSVFSFLNIKAIWFKRPYYGPEVVIEIIGADMNNRANRLFDYWTSPDTFVSIQHGDTERHTQIEGNTYQPRFLWKTKMPYRKSKGFHFHVMEANVIRGNAVMGRAFIDTDKIAEMMRTKESGLLSLGENIGVLKIVVSPPPEDLKERGVFSSTVKRLDGPEVGA